ncbi:calcium-binding protein [Actinocrinis puniceicyclus]|uniref:Calcium-binding protein n=1 Tax=Actinocrinis puniceicyclus TaxID=977794 RepID=A0A8J8BG50_9ACTN|nr:calcium-binding protein [Actinocrinis puniceicyclus]MBS2965394.1 calcium-binding protein [Actinocrinis puniceicyclus]
MTDAYGPQEQATGRYYYLQDRREFPFTAVCAARRQTSPLQVGDEVDVVAMAHEDECEREMFVALRWGPRAVDLPAVPLAQLGIAQAADEATVQAVEDWHYWVAHGYRF